VYLGVNSIMQKNDDEQPTLPSAHSAFTRPRRRRSRRNIEPSPALCRRLVYDDVPNNADAGNENEVRSGFDEVVVEEQTGFKERWSNNRGEIERQDSIASELAPESNSASSWIPIAVSSGQTPSVLKRFHTKELHLGRPDSPVPFQKQSSPVDEPHRESSVINPPNILHSSSPPSDSFSEAATSNIDQSSFCLLSRSASDIPIRSLNLTPPLSPRSKDDNLPSSKTKLHSVKLTGKTFG